MLSVRETSLLFQSRQIPLLPAASLDALKLKLRVSLSNLRQQPDRWLDSRAGSFQGGIIDGGEVDDSTVTTGGQNDIGFGYSNFSGTISATPLDDDVRWYRGFRLRGLSTQVKAGIDGRLIQR
jgi:hypothetical protein